MDITLPTNGCNISQSAGYIDNYYNGTRTRFLVNENKLVRAYSQSYTNMPTGYACLTTGDIIYKPELAVYFTLLSLALVATGILLIYKITIGKLLK